MDNVIFERFFRAIQSNSIQLESREIGSDALRARHHFAQSN
jgi:hypothetical protein